MFSPCFFNAMFTGHFAGVVEEDNSGSRSGHHTGAVGRGEQSRAGQGRATQSRAKEGCQSRRSRGFSCVIAALGWPYPNRPIGGQRSLFELNPKLATSCAGMAARARPRWRADLRALARRTKFCPRASVPAGPSDFESVFGLALHRRYLWRQLQLV